MSEWISVKDRLPDEQQHVFTYGPDNGMSIYRWCRFYGRGRNGAQTWVDGHGDDSSSYGIENYDITHWMPLPELPK